jgi:hypothetical protein
MKRSFSWQSLVGGAAWLILVLWLRPAPLEIGWVNALLLLGSLVIVPLGLGLALRSPGAGAAFRPLRLAASLQFPCALLLAASFAVPAGPGAAALALPWLAVTGLIAFGGLARLWQRRFLPWAELCFDAGLLYLAVGGGWTVLAGGEIRPLGFALPIVLLTAVHFHYAGFALPLLTGLAGRSLGNGFLTRSAALGVIAGVPMVAVGITGSQLGLGPLLEGAAAVLTAAAGLLTAALYLRLASRRSWTGAVRALWLLTALSLTCGMSLAALYGLRTWMSIPWLDLPWMWALHGTANSLGFALAGLIAWSLNFRGLISTSLPTSALWVESERQRASRGRSSPSPARISSAVGKSVQTPARRATESGQRAAVFSLIKSATQRL